MGWGDYYKKICAPRLMARKKELGLTQHEISSFVKRETGKRSKLALAGHWVNGTREPYISQFMALCEMLKLDPFDVLRDDGGGKPYKVTVIGDPEHHVNDSGTRNARNDMPKRRKK